MTYRTHTLGELRQTHVGKSVVLSGWMHKKRDHGGLIFIDLRDHYGMTQCVIDPTSQAFKVAEGLKNETVIRFEGMVVLRCESTRNNKMPTGDIEVLVSKIEILSLSMPLPLNINTEQEFPEDTRLTYRFLDLRREKIHHNMILRSKVISSLRQRMEQAGFLEYQTPILTSSSPEGARDFLVPSRVHPGQFYALPQAPQQFKQLLMVAGFDRYFQIAPCFRDEDARADRSPGEFYQLDFEMSFVTQEDVFNTIEPVIHGVFKEFSDCTLTDYPFPRIPFQEAMAKYGSDKPDLRNPLIINDLTSVFDGSDFSIFADAITKHKVVLGIGYQNATQPRSFFDKLNDWARSEGMAGLGYITFDQGAPKGPVAKFLDQSRIDRLKEICKISNQDGVFFICDVTDKAQKYAGLVRTKVAEELDLIEKNAFRFCWIVDFPMYEMDHKTGHIQFSHNPFSMPQGGLDALNTQNPLDIKAYQYDIVCNGIELSSGAIRNHLPEVMYKAFEIAGYTKDDVVSRFGGLLNAFSYGAPPHGGCAPGIDRIVMLLAGEKNIREVILFPLNQQAQDLLMQAPSPIDDSRLKELHISIRRPQNHQG
jgi:aspartyl-tRNA synthetase